jgi:hypothetical protein
MTLSAGAKTRSTRTRVPKLLYKGELHGSDVSGIAA